MRYFIFTLSFIFLFNACSSDDNPTPEPPEELNIEDYYNKYCFGYRVKDTTKLEVNDYSIIDDIVFLIGLRNNALWIGEFDRESKEQLNEYLDHVKFEKNQKLDIGYGEVVDVTINKMEVKSICRKNNYTVFSILLQDKKIEETGNFRTFFIHSKETSKKIRYRQSDFPDIIDWYENSVLLYLTPEENLYNEKNIYSCINEKGEILYSGDIFKDYHPFVYPFDYNQYISVSNSWYTPEKMRYYFSICQLEETDNFKNIHENITVSQTSESKSEISLIEKGDIWTFEIKITSIDGTVQLYYAYIDIKNYTIQITND